MSEMCRNRNLAGGALMPLAAGTILSGASMQGVLDLISKASSTARKGSL
jgi:hypothetical protein